MLENYKNEEIVYKQLKNALNNNLSHAYLFNTNDNVYANEIILSFAIDILSIESSNEPKIIKKRIENSNYSDLKIIKPDGLYIKKEQIDDLQKCFSTKPLEGTKKVYIIYEAEKLNLSAANSLLKFLEEPSNGIIGLLVTNNPLNVLKTVVSRCQLINLSKNNIDDLIKYYNLTEKLTLYKIIFFVFKKNNIDDIAECDEFLTKFICFLKFYKNNRIKSLTKIKKYFFDLFIEKTEVIYFFNCLILFYRDIIGFKINKKILYFDDYIDLVEDFSNLYNIDDVVRCIKIIVNKEKLLNSNVNINMLIDSLLIEMEDLW